MPLKDDYFLDGFIHGKEVKRLLVEEETKIFQPSSTELKEQQCYLVECKLDFALIDKLYDKFLNTKA